MFPQISGPYSTCLVNDRTEQFPSPASQNVALGLYACPHDCRKTFRRQHDLGRHIKEQHTCPLQDCVGKLFPTPTERKRHLQNEHHENGFMYKCGSCGLNGPPSRAFTRREKLKKHFNDSHRITEPQWSTFQCREYPCYVEEFCGGTWFLSQDQLNQHIRSDHAERPEASEYTSKTGSIKVHDWTDSSSISQFKGFGRCPYSFTFAGDKQRWYRQQTPA